MAGERRKTSNSPASFEETLETLAKPFLMCYNDKVPWKRSMWSTYEGNPIAGEVEYGGLSDSLEQLSQPHEAAPQWLYYYLEYVDFLN